MSQKFSKNCHIKEIVKFRVGCLIRYIHSDSFLSRIFHSSLTSYCVRRGDHKFLPLNLTLLSTLDSTALIYSITIYSIRNSEGFTTKILFIKIAHLYCFTTLPLHLLLKFLILMLMQFTSYNAWEHNVILWALLTRAPLPVAHNTGIQYT